MSSCFASLFATTISFSVFVTPLTLCYRPPTFLNPISSRFLVRPSHTTYKTPRILRVTHLGPPEKVGSVNRVHGNRACHSPRSFAPPFLPHPSEIALSPSISPILRLLYTPLYQHTTYINTEVPIFTFLLLTQARLASRLLRVSWVATGFPVHLWTLT